MKSKYAIDSLLFKWYGMWSPLIAYPLQWGMQLFIRTCKQQASCEMRNRNPSSMRRYRWSFAYLTQRAVSPTRLHTLLWDGWSFQSIVSIEWCWNGICYTVTLGDPRYNGANKCYETPSKYCSLGLCSLISQGNSSYMSDLARQLFCFCHNVFTHSNLNRMPWLVPLHKKQSSRVSWHRY
jgi:hypothetical protein